MVEKTKEQEEQLRKLRAEVDNYRSIIENLHGVAYSMTCLGVFTYLSPQIESFGYKRQSLVGTSWGKLLVADNKEKALSDLEELLDGKAPPRRYRIKTKKGEQRLIEDHGCLVRDDNGKPIAVSGSFVDVTEQVSLLEKLKQREQRFRELAEALPEIVYEMDAKGVITFVNDQGLATTGYNRADVERGFTALHIVAPVDHQRAAANMGRVLQGEKLEGGREYTVQRKDGSTYPALIHSTPIVKDGQITGARGVIFNISDQKKAEQEKKNLEQQVVQSHKLEAIGRLAGGVSHDFNNMLQIIIVYCDMLLDSMAEDDGLRADVQEIWNVAHRAAALTRQLLAFSRQQLLASSTFDVCDILSPTELILKRTLGEDIELLVSCEKGVHFISADATQLEMALVNLAINSRQSMPEGGKLTITAVPLDKESLTPTQRSEIDDVAYCLIKVSDTGCGMDEKTRARAFDPFFTTSELGLRAGLGLSTVYGIVKQSNGLVWLESELGQGTTVSICLPTVAGKGTDVQRAKSGKGELLMIVEDDHMLRSSWTRLLKESGYRVLSAPHGLEATKLAQACEGKIDLLITDVVLPEISGSELAEKLRLEYVGLPVIFVSGYPSDMVAEKLDEREKLNFLQKPVPSIRLLEMVRSVLDSSPA